MNAITLSKREKRTVGLSLAAAAAICIYFLIADPALRAFTQSRQELKNQRARLTKLLAYDNPVQQRSKRLAEIVPVLEPPKKTDIQGALLRDEMTKQLKKAGVDVRSLTFVKADIAASAAGMEKILLQCRGKCRYEAVLNLLAGLKTNPYCVGVEELTITTDTKKREELEITLTVSTFAGQGLQ